MIQEIDERLHAWAEWLNAPAGASSRLGWPSRSAEQRCLEMRNYTTPGRRQKCRWKRLSTPQDPLGPPTFPPANTKQTRGVREIKSPRNTSAEATDLAVAQMPEYLSKALKLIYVDGRTLISAAEQMRVSPATIKSYVNVAHGWLDGHFHPQQFVP